MNAPLRSIVVCSALLLASLKAAEPPAELLERFRTAVRAEFRKAPWKAGWRYDGGLSWLQHHLIGGLPADPAGRASYRAAVLTVANDDDAKTSSGLKKLAREVDVALQAIAADEKVDFTRNYRTKL